MQELQKDLYKLKRVTGEKKNLRAVCDQCECMSESKSTFGKICWWRRQLLIGELSIEDNPGHLQAPAGVDFQVAMHEPYPYLPHMVSIVSVN